MDKADVRGGRRYNSRISMAK